MRLHTISFGCQMAFADTEEMSKPFAERGWLPTPDLADADAVLVNTCTVREHAEHRALSQIGRLSEWKRARPDRLLIVAGCAAERLKDTLRSRFPHVDLVVGAKSIEEFPALVARALDERFDLAAEDAESFEAPPPQADAPNPVSAFVTIMRGCNYSCTYCIVPAVRGRELYRDADSIVAEVRAKAAAGAKEVVLLGQTVNSYRRGDLDFAGLLARVDAVEGIDRIRFMSPHPHYLDERMVAAMAGLAKVCEHLHLPAQSGSDRLLKAMRRNYTRGEYLQRTHALRRAVPGVALTTDIIVGFPGETDADFDESLEFIEEAAFDAAYCFKFSPRAGTAAAEMDGQVPEEVREARLARLLERVMDRGRRRLDILTGQTLEVLVEEPALGRTRTNRLVKLQRTRRPGETVRVRVKREASASGGLIEDVPNQP